MATQTSDCPVCGCTFQPSVIDEHVNSCLNKQDSIKPTNTTKRKTNEWSFLKRETRPNESDRSNSNAKSAKRIKTTKSNVELSQATKGKRGVSFGPKHSISRHRSNADDDVIDLDLDSDLEIGSEELRDPHAESEANQRNHYHERNRNGEEKDEKLVLAKTTDSGALGGHKNINGSGNPQKSDGKGYNFSGSMNSNSHSVVDKNELFATSRGKKEKVDLMKVNAPLAEKVRPQNFDDYIGQNKAVGKRSLLHTLLLNSDNVPSMILWGPPGCGKTTLAKIIAHRCQQRRSAKFVAMSATSASVSDVKEVAKVAQNDLKMFRKKTILFLDEIHRFNKLQQDALLPHVENGIITLIGATTENPSFQVNGALLSRCRVITLEKLEIEDIKTIIKRACHKIGVRIKSTGGETNRSEEVQEDEDENFSMDRLCDTGSPMIEIEEIAVDALASLVDGDARTALNGLQMTVEARKVEDNGDPESPLLITLENVKEGLQRSHVLYDRNGEEHYNIASALIKSMRGSDDTAALYWMTRMLVGGEDPLFIARRLVVFASEDVGLADPSALSQAVATYQACHFIGKPDCGVNLAQCVVYLSRAPKSVESYMAFTAAKELIERQEGPMPGVPLHLRNAPTKLLKSLGCGKGYKYPPAFEGKVLQDYLPKELIGTDFFAKTKGQRPRDPDLPV